ncbi:ribbon-helix-helix protein, CopG family [Fulvivirga lutea]|uniref:CopG family transcriptional regulator n=1 Tax=Fulvivirga lutea TaxID=2810512 RepID=A0A975A1N6_9BACT|nr:ribbon-helix-helix protein, CopG family [Fulvivirga lutea]QSE98021.1 CopG family transcriptional regulator [Fulvivirga lutea]
MLNVRLDKELEKKLQEYSNETHTSKTDIVKEALALYFSKKEKSKDPFLIGQDLFGVESSGQKNLSSNYKKILKKKLNDKHTH